MKKRSSYLLAVMLFVFVGLRTNAQTQRGYVLVGADIADFNLGLDEGGNFNFLLNPKAAWFIKDNIAIGGFLTFGLNTAKDAGEDITYGIGALGRYYLNKDTGNLSGHSCFFFEGTVGIEGDNPATGDNTNGLGIGVGPGWTFFLTRNIALEALFKYNLIVGFGSSATSNNLNLNIGFQVYLPTSRLRKISQEAMK